MYPSLELRFAGCRYCQTSVVTQIFPNGKIKFNPTSHASGPTCRCQDRIDRQVSSLLQLVFTLKQNDLVASEIETQIDFGREGNALLVFIDDLRKNLVEIANQILLDVKEGFTSNSLQEFAWLIGTSSRLTLDRIAHCPLFTKLSIAFYRSHGLDVSEQILLLTELMSNSKVDRDVKVRLCGLIGSIGSLTCLLPLANASSCPFVGSTARAECARMLLQSECQNSLTFENVLSKIVVALNQVNPTEFRMMLQGDLGCIFGALRLIMIDCNQEYSPEQRASAVILLHRLKWNEATSELREFYRNGNSACRWLVIDELLKELVDAEFNPEANVKYIAELIVGCLAYDEQGIRDVVLEILSSRDKGKLLKEIAPERLHSIEIESSKEDELEPMQHGLAILRPGTMLRPRVPKKLRVLEACMKVNHNSLLS